MAEQLGLVRIATPAEVTQEEEDKRKAKLVDETQDAPALTNLGQFIQKCWQAARDAKSGTINDVEDRLMKCQRQRDGFYEPDEITAIEDMNSADIYMQLTSIKCRGAEAWISDALLPAGEKPWGLVPSPQVELPGQDQDEVSQRFYEELMTAMEIIGSESVAAMLTPEEQEKALVRIQDEVTKENLEEAKEEAKRMEVRLEDQLVEGQFYEEFKKFIKDMATFPTAFMKGPVIHAEDTQVWDYETKTIPVIETVYRRHWEVISPFDMYPSPSAKNIQDGYLIQRHRLRRNELYKYIGVKGFDDDAIRAVLKEHSDGNLKSWLHEDMERDKVEGTDHADNDPEGLIEALEFWGPIPGRKLLEWETLKENVHDFDKDYNVTCWKIGRYIIMARLNVSPVGRRPYYCASFEEKSNSIWGKSVPELMRDCQRICNSTARALINNMSIASGPQVEVFANRLHPAEDAEDIYPWKVWMTKTDEAGGSGAAVNFFQPTIHAEPLLAVYDFFFKQASEQSGIPAHVYGSSDVGGAGKTASGLAMLMNAASKTLKSVISHIDNGIIKPVIDDLWLHMILFDDFDKRGDINVVARASEYLIVAEQIQLRRNEFMQATMNPVDMQIIGEAGRAELLRESVKALKLNESIVPGRERFEGQGGPPQQAPQQIPQGGSQKQPSGAPQQGEIPIRKLPIGQQEM